MATIERFEDLEIWQIAREIYHEVSTIADYLRKKHEYKFADQMKGAAGSTMDNIAEGFERSSRLEFVNSLGVSKGECGELMSQFYRCIDNKYIDDVTFNRLYSKTRLLTKKIAKFIAYLNKSIIRGLKFKDRKDHKNNKDRADNEDNSSG